MKELDYWGRPLYYDMDGKPMDQMEYGDSYYRNRHVGDDYLKLHGHVYRVSTVWLGLNHAFSPNMPPLIFETMVFRDDRWDGLDIMERYSTKAQAKAGHARIRAMVRKMIRSQPRPRQLIHKGSKP